jgi:hypothetical protein
MNAIRINTQRFVAATPRKPASPQQHQRVALRAYTALAELCNGTARMEELEDLADSANVVEALAAMGKFDAGEITPWMDAAVIGFSVALKCPPGMMRMGKDATWAMRNLVTRHDEAMGKFSQQTMLDAWAMVIVKMADPKATLADGVIRLSA